MLSSILMDFLPTQKQIREETPAEKRTEPQPKSKNSLKSTVDKASARPLLTFPVAANIRMDRNMFVAFIAAKEPTTSSSFNF